MTVTEIVPYDKKRDKVLIDGDLVLLLYKGEIKKLKLEEDLEISDGFYADAVLPLLKKRARERIVYLLKDSDKSERDIRRRLKEGLYPNTVIDNAVEWAKLNKYIDDERYAENYIRYHGEGEPARRLSWKLQQKGISKEIIDRYLEETETDEAALIEKELAKKHYDPETADEAAKRKMAAYLMRRGFSWESIRNGISF